MSARIWEQSGAIPWRTTADGSVEVLLITSRTSGELIVPKGLVEAHLGVVGSAAEEAWEEAGVRGTMCHRQVGSYRKRKWGGICEVALFMMEVTEVSSDWLESDERERVWVPLADAASRVGPPGLAEVMSELPLLADELRK